MQILDNSPFIPKSFVIEGIACKTHQIIDQTIFGV